MKEHRKQSKAQKAYVCDMCFCEILKGQQYIRLVTEDNGSLKDTRLHIHCDILRCACPDAEEGGFRAVAQWISDRVCNECGIGECDGNPFICGKVIGELAPDSLVGAAQDSIRQSEGWV